MNLYLFHNYKIKLIALVFAIFIWFFVVTENDYETILEIPVVPVNLPPGKILLNEIPQNVKIKIKGTGKDLIAVGVGSSARLEIDLSNVEKKKSFFLEPKNVFLSRPIGFITTEEVLTPDSLTVVIDDYSVKTVPVIPELKIKIAPGYTQAGKIRIFPDSVTISGPESIISKVNELRTQYSDEANPLKFDFKKKLPIILPPYDKFEININQVDVYLNIQKLVELEITGVPVQIRNLPADETAYVVPSTLSLILEGGGDMLTYVDRNDIVAYLDYNRIKNSPGKEYPAAIVPPPGISYRDVKPTTFKLVFENKGAK